jgi:hypothetical protein
LAVTLRSSIPLRRRVSTIAWCWLM